MFSNFFFSKNPSVFDIMCGEKNGETGQATDDNIGPNVAHALRMLDN